MNRAFVHQVEIYLLLVEWDSSLQFGFALWQFEHVAFLHSLLHAFDLLGNIHSPENVLNPVESPKDVQTHKWALFQLLLEKLVFRKVAIPKIEIQLVPQLEDSLLPLHWIQCATRLFLVLNIVHFHWLCMLHDQIGHRLHSFLQLWVHVRFSNPYWSGFGWLGCLARFHFLVNLHIWFSLRLNFTLLLMTDRHRKISNNYRDKPQHSKPSHRRRSYSSSSRSRSQSQSGSERPLPSLRKYDSSSSSPDHHRGRRT